MDQSKRFQFTLRTWLAAMGVLALGFLWLPVLPALAWWGLFLGPHADRRRNRTPVLVLAAAFYVPASLCVFASQQSRWDPHLAWDQAARDYCWISPLLPGFLSAMPLANLVSVNITDPICQAAMGIATFVVLALFTKLARVHIALLVPLAVLAFCYSFVMSLAVPAGMRM